MWERPHLYPEQLAAIYHAARYAIIEATPKCGKTFGCLAWLVEMALQGRPGWEYWWVAPVSDQALIALNRLRHGLSPVGEYTINESLKRVLLLPMRTVIAFKSADHPDSLYGEDVHGLVIDEGTRVKREAWYALRTTLTATGGRVRIISNVKGRKNWMYELARAAEGGAPEMHYARLTAEHAIAAGIFPREELEDARRRLPEPVFRELYYAEASADEGNPFGEQAIADGILPEYRAEGGAIDWSLPGGVAATWGVDIAETQDWNAAIGIDTRGRAVEVHRWHGPWSTTRPRILALVGDCPTLVDATGLQSLLVEELSLARPNVAPYKFTSESKAVLVGSLVDVLQRRQVKYPDGAVPEELRSFEYVYSESGKVKYEAREGAHDDLAIALALAVHAGRGMTADAWLAFVQERRAPPAAQPAASREVWEPEDS